MNNDKIYKTAIIGGGAAGFFAATNITEALPNMEIHIFESSRRIQSKNCSSLNAGALGARRAPFSKTWSVSGTHTIMIKVSARAGRPLVETDAFLLIRQRDRADCLSVLAANPVAVAIKVELVGTDHSDHLPHS